ncbi:DUF2442 domain-containing protein [Desulfobacula toluolica]|uniref:DUF2442 domain-containing protein n=1 Tax=Desulfobacula toluolica TaxID=28223 RepID=UPI001E35957E|nr:DUF2442 domain-containing protein [Desulfobacula toluolica]
MTTLMIKIESLNANNVIVTNDSLVVELDDGRTVSVPTAWYPRLLHASEKERKKELEADRKRKWYTLGIY